jgi:chromosome partitioning protein
LTANLGAELAYRGKRVLMIDLDPQTSLTFSFIQPDVWERTYSGSKTIKTWFDSHEDGKTLALEGLVVKPRRVLRYFSGAGMLHLIPSHLALINVDLDLATQLGGANLRQSKRRYVQVHRRLADGLQAMPSDYDLVLIDCPPNFNIVTKTAIVASDYILVPARPDGLSTLGIDYLMRSVRQLVDDYNEYADHDPSDEMSRIDPKLLGVIFTMVQEYGRRPISAQRPYIDRVRSLGGIDVFDHYIRRNDTLFAGSSQSGVPAVLVGHSPGTYRDVVAGLEDVASEFLERLF